jgi:hypothetical protein
VSCECLCHLGPNYDCDVTGGFDGGCGYLHAPAVDTAHRCARGDRCAERTPERNEQNEPTGAWLAAPVTVERGLCDGCRRDLEHALNHLVGDVVELTMMIGRVGSTGDVLVSSSPELQIPLQVNVEALRAEIDSELQNWAEPVAEKLGVEWDTEATSRCRMAVRVQRAAHLLTRAVDTLLALPPTEHPAWEQGLPVWDRELGCQEVTVRDGVDAAISLIDLHRRAYVMLGRTKLVHRLSPPCPWCDHKELVRHNGEGHVTCEHCHRIIEEKHYDWFAAVLIREEERLRADRQAEEAAA